MTEHELTRRQALLTGAAAATAAALPARAAPAGDLAFLTLGDWGRDGASHQRDVADAMGRRAAAIGSSFVVAVGDNFYDSGVQTVHDAQWKTSYEDVYVAPTLQTPWYVALGNHDYRGNPQAQLDYARTSPRWRMPARYWRERVAGPGGQAVDLFILDTSPLVVRYATSLDKEDAVIRANVMSQDVPAQKQWLETELAASDAPWKLVFGHHPVFSGGKHGNTAELVAWLKPLLEQHGVQAYVCGHDHDLQHIVSGPVHYICSGAGSEVRPVKAIPGTRFCIERSGFTSYSLSKDLLSVDFVDYQGQVVHTARVPRQRVPAHA